MHCGITLDLRVGSIETTKSYEGAYYLLTIQISRPLLELPILTQQSGKTIYLNSQKPITTLKASR